MSKYIFTKNSTRIRPRNISESDFISASFGQVYEYEPIDRPARIYHFSGTNSYNSDDYLYFNSLKNIINYYKAQDDIFNFEALKQKPITLISLSSAHFGAGIEKGTVQLNYYISGNLLAEASDYREDGVIYSGSSTNTGSNIPVGFVLYNEGFIAITSTGSLSGSVYQYSSSYNGLFNDNPRWIHSYISASSKVVTTVDYNVKNDLSTNINFVYANKYEFNHSNNSTYLKSGSYSYVATSSSFEENNKCEIKNTIKSNFLSGSSIQDKQTFITKIGLYDKEKKLIAVASLANPIRKTENREFIFKLKIDI